MPRNFFDLHVQPNYEEWLDDPLDQRRAKNAVANANDMAERVYHHWKDTDSARVFNAANKGKYRDELAERECRDFGLVRDVADAHKHVTLDKGVAARERRQPDRRRELRLG